MQYFLSIPKGISPSELKFSKCLKTWGVDKFFRDGCLIENEDYFFFLTGVVLNKPVLPPTGKTTWANFCLRKYKEAGVTFFKSFKGSYNGTLFDKKANKWIIFSNVQSEQPVYLSETEDEYLLSSKISAIKEHLSLKNQKLTLNESAAYMLLSYGFMLENFTLYNEVKKLKAGFYFDIENERCQELQFYQFNNIDKTKENKSEIIERVDTLFKAAVKNQFEKDREYGYKHCSMLSGGLDSRMTTWCANKLGYDEQLNITFAQTGSGDEWIPKELAAYLKHEWMFKSLDYGNYIKNQEKVTQFTEGNSISAGSSHALSMFELLNLKNHGLNHTGVIGDVIISWNYPKNRAPKHGDGAFSNKLISRIPEDVIDLGAYENDELFKINNRYINGINYNLVLVRDFTCSISPFYDLDLWNYCLSIPLELRYNHKLYKEWMIKKYPDAAGFVWDQTNVRVKYNFWKDKKIFYQGRGTDIPELISGSYRKVARKLNIRHKPSLNAMNPMESWYILNPDLKNYIHSYFEDHISLLDGYQDLKKDATALFREGKVTEKLQVLSLLSAVKEYC